MKKEHAQFLMDACAEANVDCEIHPNYSGRGMFGAETYAVSGNELGILCAGINYARDEPDALQSPIETLRIDNYGHDAILY